MGYTICVAKTKALIRCAVTAQLTCAFGFAYSDCWFSDATAHLLHEIILDFVSKANLYFTYTCTTAILKNEHR